MTQITELRSGIYTCDVTWISEINISLFMPKQRMGGSRSRENNGFKNNNLHPCWESIPDSRVIWSLVSSLYVLSFPVLNLLARSTPHETVRSSRKLVANIVCVCVCVWWHRVMASFPTFRRTWYDSLRYHQRQYFGRQACSIPLKGW